MKNAGKPYEGELHVRFDEGWVRSHLPTLSLFDPDYFGSLRENVFVSNPLNEPEHPCSGISFRVRV